MKPLRFLTAMRRRLRWPIPLLSRSGDRLGDYAASCSTTGLLKRRSVPIERVWARVLKEGGARVRGPVALRDAGVPVHATDRRHIEIIATGLPMMHGVPIAVDATMVSPLHSNGIPWPGAAERPGVALGRARNTKEETYPELLQSPHLRLLTAGIETGGRLSSQALELLNVLASTKAESEPPALQVTAARAWRARWITMVSFVSQDSLAATLVDEGLSILDAPVAPCPLSVDVWLDSGP